MNSEIAQTQKRGVHVPIGEGDQDDGTIEMHLNPHDIDVVCLDFWSGCQLAASKIGLDGRDLKVLGDRCAAGDLDKLTRHVVGNLAAKMEDADAEHLAVLLGAYTRLSAESRRANPEIEDEIDAALEPLLVEVLAEHPDDAETASRDAWRRVEADPDLLRRLVRATVGVDQRVEERMKAETK